MAISLMDLLAFAVGILGMLLALLFLLGDRSSDPEARRTDNVPAAAPTFVPVAVDQDSFIPMPDHLTTHAEMVTWITEEVPRLTEGMGAKPQSR